MTNMYRFKLNFVAFLAQAYEQVDVDVDDVGNETEEELKPLINGDESHEEAKEINQNDSSDRGVQFKPDQDEPVESRLK